MLNPNGIPKYLLDAHCPKNYRCNYFSTNRHHHLLSQNYLKQQHQHTTIIITSQPHSFIFALSCIATQK